MLRKVRAKPRETAATGGIPPSQRTAPQRERHAWPDVVCRPRQTAARVDFGARKRTAPQGERQQNGDLRPREEVRSGILRASEGPKNTSAPQENPLRGKNAPRHGSRKRIEHFSFRHQNFSQTFRGHVLPTKDATPQPQ